ncbi:MAG: FAD-dependent oxidoreductase, partial [Pseudomonadota bacterium]
MNEQELKSLEDCCIQEWAPWCTAYCPVHVDVRAMCAALSKGDFRTAAGVFRRSVPFPGIISRICDHPCESVCKRREAGDPIAVRELERALSAHAGPLNTRSRPVPKKSQSVAVVGSGLSGLTVAFDLAGKGYRVTVFEAAERIGGYTRHYPETLLPQSVIQEDLAIFDGLTVDIRPDSPVDMERSRADLVQQYDAVYLGIGRSTNRNIGIGTDESGRALVDPVTFETGLHGVFAGGSLVCVRERYSPITSVSQGRRAAVSIDRFLQKVSLTAGRENEGPYETRLFTSTRGVDDLARVIPAESAQGYSPDEARVEASRCLLCECMECVKVCEFLAQYKGYPKKYVRQVYNNLSIVMGQRHGNKFINSCSLCGLCKAVCPEESDMGEVCKAARGIMTAQGKMPPSVHEFALADMEFSNGSKASFARHAPGSTSGKYLFFPGCQLSGLSPDNVAKTYGYLRDRLEGGVGLMLRCCGAPADWAGRAETFARVLSDFRNQWTEMGHPEMVLACSSCYAVLKAHLPEVPLVSLWEVFDRYGLPEGVAKATDRTVSVHDPCTSRYETRIQAAVRNIVQSLGFEIAELPLSRDKTACCGFGGLMYFADRDLAQRVIRRRVSGTAGDLTAYCAVCCDHFASMGKPTTHLLDLIFGGQLEQRAEARTPDYSQRRENRVRLKN